ncbi:MULTISPECIES: hypothetical protein [Inquilinus]|uniref:GntR family transcriptional regulator n=1 Tax=Inquilinus ginsengisoli TaxID=363840 RepID=A0ABU1JVX0_9PROT|nr:hypothetical protein [Inquilinus ginsengisoli]MDR6291709.1 hypothetical protein [Inquilinus ginsengisoli]
MNMILATDIPLPAVFDLAAFPLVQMPVPQAEMPGYGDRWAVELDAILARETRFVMLSIGPMPDGERHDDRKARTLWLKRRRGDLARLCLSHLHVEPDPLRRAAMQAMVVTARVAKAFPYPIALFADEEAALERAWSLLRSAPLAL